MAEKLTLATPVVSPSITEWSVIRIDKNREERYLLIQVKSNTGMRKEHVYRGDDAMNKMRVLNKTNNTIKTEERRIIEQLQTDGILEAGTIEGTPD